jgi:DNA repair exonuclease SbcCD ATPase subunit
MILFKKLRWKNFLSTGNIFTEIDLNSNSTTLIVGENGSGKSTMLDALSFVLFGKPFRKINKPQLLNTITNKQLVVEVEFTIGQNNYKIVRGIKPNIFQVYQNDNLLNQSAETKDYQEILEKQIIKVNHKSFCQVVILGSATFQPFMQLTASQRRDIIEDLLDLQIFTTMNSLLKDKLLLNSESISFFSSEKKLLEEKIKLIKEHLKELQNNNHKVIEEKKSRIVETNEQIDRLNKEYLGYETQLKELEISAEDEQSINKKSQKLQGLKHKIEANLGLLNKEVGFFHKYDNCPTCKQQIDSKFKAETITSKEKEIKKISDGLEKLSSEYEKVSNRITELLDIRSQINDRKMEINRVKTKITSLVEYQETLETEIKNINKSLDIEDDSKISDLEKQLKEIEEKYYEYVEDRNILSVTSSLLKDGGIKARIIKQYIPVINKLINKYLSGMKFMCQFELDEEFSETIKSRYRDVFSYASFSEGEKQKIDVALLFTWRAVARMRNSVNTNLLLFDEILDSSMDSNSIENFFNIIKGFDNNNIFIISHREQISDKFEKVIKFKKVKNFSTIEG